METPQKPARSGYRASKSRAMHRLRDRLIAAFLVATILPLAATVWITTSLLERSLDYATTEELDRLSRSLEDTVRQFYQRERDALRAAALAGRVRSTPHGLVGMARWPERLRAFWESEEPERFDRSGPGGDHLDYMRRTDQGVEVYSRDLGGIRMQELSDEFGQTRELVESLEGRDLRRGFTLTLFLLVALVWLVSLVPVIFIAHRFSRPIQQLTAGLTDFAAGDWDRAGSRPAGTTTMRSGTPSGPSTTWPSSSGRTAIGSCIWPRCRAGSRSPGRPPMS